MEENWKLLGKLGILVIPNFLPPALCHRIISSSYAADGYAATVGDESRVDTQIRSTRVVPIQEGVRSELFQTFDDLQPQLANFFGCELVGREAPQLLRYLEGDFFRIHQDRHAESKGEIAKRLVTTVTFVNDPMDGTYPYAGGDLRLYGLFDNPALADAGLPVKAAQGLLIAFRPDTLHEVTPVSRGQRYTLTTWYH
ncbi:MAG: 2OG-Fe(II) oxygenase [Anaerolineales bacterium]|nr:2OG-Fe(II) oxygenase [Anaerolineales bacterium]MCB9126543.1 2OG-Fe(II) oxygenase [Ardenticatenales bacterium]